MSEPPLELSLRSAELVRSRHLEGLDWLAPVALLPFTLTPFLGWLLSSHDRFLLGLFAMEGLTLLAPFLLLLGGVLAWVIAGRRRGTVRVDQEGLVLSPGGAAVRVPAEDIALAWATDATRVEAFTRQGDHLLLHLATYDAERLVAAIRARQSRDHAYTVPGEHRIVRFFRKSVAWIFGAGVGTGAGFIAPAALPLVGVFAGLAWLAAKGSPSVRFGADGVEVRGRFRRRYVPFRDIASVEMRSFLVGFDQVVVRLEDGSRVRVASWLTGHRARLLVALLEEGRHMVGVGEAAGAHVPSLERGAEDEEAWRARVAKAASGGDYRGAALDPERLLALVRNPAARAEQRVAAALALRRVDGGPARIRVAAEVSTDPEVRDALEALAEEELDEPRVRRAIAGLGR